MVMLGLGLLQEQALLLVDMEGEQRSRRCSVPPQQDSVDVGGESHPAATLC